MSFKKNKYVVVRNALKKDWCDFAHVYFNLKFSAIHHLRVDLKQYLPDCMGHVGNDSQSSSYFHNYGDMLGDSLLYYLSKPMSEETGLHLIPTYSYMRIYKKGAILKKHTDRPSCEISATLNISGGESWPIYVQPKKGKKKKSKVILKPGDLLIYRGMDLHHWRDKFKQQSCIQIFLHYNDENGPFGKTNLFDGRKTLGISK